MGKIQGYRMFESPHAEWPFSFLYPEGWKVREITAEDSIEIFIAGPRNRADTFTVSLTVGTTWASGKSLKAFLNEHLTRYRSLSGFREIACSRGLLAGSEAVEVEIAYTMLLPLSNVDAQMTPIRERRIFLKQGQWIYELIYAATEEEYETWFPAFQTLAHTFTFKEEPTEGQFRYLITPVSMQVIGEKGGEYETQK